MKLKKITLNNIRSYETETIGFPDRSTLLSGDIGSGKTSILLGIEFALFGLQPGQRGAAILKNGKKEGGVAIEFLIDGKEVKVERTLKRGSKTITQDYCAITIDGEKIEASVTEIKDKVLEILNYPKEFAKKQNLLYKFTVYTPQEEMKQIINEDSDVRVNTLRHVFGIDKYKQIIENSAIIASKLREEKRIKQALTANYEQEKLDLVEKEEELETKQYNIVSVEKELFAKTELRKNIQEEKEVIEKKIEEKKKLESEAEKAKLMIANKKESIASNNKLIPNLERQISEIKVLKFEESKITEVERSINEKKDLKKTLNEKNLDVSSKIASLSMKNQENDEIKGKITRIEVCPTCLQDVSAVYKANVSNKLDSNISQNKKEIALLTTEKKKITDEISKLDYQINFAQKELQDLSILKVKTQDIKEKEARLEEIRKLNLSFEKDVSLLEMHMQSLKASSLELSRYENLFIIKQRELDNAMKEERLAELKVAELKKEIEVFSRHIDEFKEKLKKAAVLQKELEYITELETWLSKKFVPLLSLIERNVMLKLKTEFSKLFQEWFSMLVAEDFHAALDDNFTPIIEQQDYLIEYPYLSGGERTAVALAYRLALNQVINSLLSKIKTKDFVILDEPTDGFSDAQLDKMRDVLQQLNVSQLIIVSHEQKMEGFVDNVIRFRKENGISKRVD
ncbi:hypothetical protein COU56_05140 [Candidatus Pacearchaeota archaeon CG10_big_fil_rev_8_21_14_0_10_31_9]|nr:MAG: hypothetical protein COU56_05140 [Candidatus Pacearchaeota archaeon CG10_big_fil_rev_8_21_14_0_10_31_9]